MLNILLASDDDDTELGHYFTKCRELLTSQLTDVFQVYELTAAACNSTHLDVRIQAQNETPFILAAYMHGQPESLIARRDNFIYRGEQNRKFKKSFIYSSACSAGELLGPDLVSYGCACFIGYKRSVDKLISDATISKSALCDNYALICLLHSDVTAYSAFQSMSDFLTHTADEYMRSGDPLSASITRDAREALIFCGDKTLTRSSLVSN